MSQVLNFYCDESCHLLNDRHEVMTLGTVWCLAEKRREICVRLREIKVRHGLSSQFEVKWGKISPAKAQFYLDWLDLFLDDDDLHFRAVVVPRKSDLLHRQETRNRDDWYYTTYFELLSVLLTQENRHRIYVDIKDTHSATKMARLHDVLCINAMDFDRRIIERIQVVPSHDSELIQLADVLIGAVGYVNRGLSGNAGKEALINRLRNRTGLSLRKTTLPGAEKLNLSLGDGIGGGA